MDIRNFIIDEEGSSMAEYALLLGLITIVVIAVVGSLGTSIQGKFSEAESAI